MATVREILARKGSEVVTADPGQTVLEAAQLMNSRGIGAVVVTEGGEMQGIFTERDVLRRVVAEERDPRTMRLRDVMTPTVVTTTDLTTVEECGELMTRRRIRHLPVLTGGRLAGIVTIGDLMAWQVADQAATIAQLNSYVYDNR
jgi:CBS domain-containing protein